MKYLKNIIRAVKREKFRFKIEPINELTVINNASNCNYKSSGSNPYFYLESLDKKNPGGWIKICIKAKNTMYPSELYFDDGTGYNENNKIILPLEKNKKIAGFAKIPDKIAAFRFNPQSANGYFYIGEIYIQELSKIEIGIRLLFLSAYEELKDAGKLKSKVKRTLINKENLFLKIKNKIKKKLISNSDWAQDSVNYENYINLFEKRTLETITKNKNYIIESFKTKPLISLIMPAYNTPEDFLEKAIDSVINQIYPYWELCIADDASTKQHIKEILEYYKQKDGRIKVIFRSENGHISKASNSALSLATGDYIALIDHDDILHETALFFVVKEINEYPDAKLIYSDEDKINEEGVRIDPYFKSDWNPDLFLSQNIIKHLGVYKRSIVEDIGSFKEGYDGSQDYDLALRFIEKIKYSEIRHIPRVLYHWRMAEGSTASIDESILDTKPYCLTSARQAVQDHLDRLNIKAKVVEAPLFPIFNRVLYDTDQNILVSIIIPTYNGYEILKICIDSIVEKTLYKNYEIIIVNNNSDDKKTVEYLNSINGRNNIKFVNYNEPFNYPAINNFAVKFAKGEVLVLLNNDTEVINNDWLRELVSHAMRNEVGAVGAKLLYPDDTIQHAGVIIGLEGLAGHIFYKIYKDSPGYFGRANLLQNYSAVTGACIALRKKIYEEVGGMDENLAVAFNDIDFCLKVGQSGYYNVYTPYALLYHHESKTRGYDDTKEKLAILKKECDYFKTKWKEIVENDPMYNPNLSLNKEFSPLLHPRVKFKF